MSSLRPQGALGLAFLKLASGEALARLIAFAALAYVARMLGANAFGMVVLALTVMTYAVRVSDCGVDMLGAHDVAQTPNQLPALLSSFVGARLLVSAALVVVIVTVGTLAFPQPDGAVLSVFALTLLPIALGTRWAHLALEQPGIVSISRAASEGLSAIAIVALVHSPEDVVRVPLAQILGEALGAILLLRALPRQARAVRPLIRLDVVVSLYRRSWPLVLQALLGLAIFSGDVLILRIYRDAATVGYYAAAYAPVSFIVNVGYAYSMNLLPEMARQPGNRARDRGLYHDALAHVFAGIFPIALGGCLLANRLIPLVYDSGYFASVLPLQIIIWTLPVALFYSIARSVLLAFGRQRDLLRLAAWTAGINLVFNFALIPAWGMIGAAVVSVASETILAILVFQAVHKVGLPLAAVSRFVRPLLAGGVMAAAVTALRLLPLGLTMTAGAVVYVLTLVLMGGIRLRRNALPEITL